MDHVKGDATSPVIVHAHVYHDALRERRIAVRFSDGTEIDKPLAEIITSALRSEIAMPDMNESGWTPEQALRFYATGKHFDVVEGRTRILDTGAVASDALKGLSAEYAAGKGTSVSATAESLTTETADSVERYRLALQLLWELHGQKEVHLGMERHSGVAQHCASCICWAALNDEVDVKTLKVELEILRAPHKDRHHE